MRIEEVAKYFNVSSATIRNWIKTGELLLDSAGYVSKASILALQLNISDKKKLSARANKSKKDSHNHQQLEEKIYQALQTDDVHQLGNFYEGQLSDSYRNKEGIYYTPIAIVEDLLSAQNVENKTFLDPCCGSGNFIMRAIELGFKPENIYGIDIDPLAVKITKERIKKETGYITNNIICDDFLELCKNNSLGYYDYIYTNPPWGKKINKSQKIEYAEIFNAGISQDTSSLFFFACLNRLNSEGKLGLLLPEAFFNIASFESARERLFTYQIDTLKDYGKAFKGLQTGAVALELTKTEMSSNRDIVCVYQNQTFLRSVASFINNPKKILNVNCNREESEVITYLYSQLHETLEGKASWGLGIVTGNNEKYVKSNPQKGFIPVYKGSDITLQGLKEPSHFISDEFSLYQQVAPQYLFKAKEKLIYKFISSNLCFFYDDKQRYPLNSANMLIVNEEFPVSMKVLAELFNSELMNWLFKKLFNTHKVLRGDLEKMPIFTQFLTEDTFNEAEYLENINIEKIENGTFRIKK